MTIAATHDLFIFDLDGVVYIGPAAVPGAVAGITRLHELGLGVAYATDNASRRASSVTAHLAELGVPSSEGEVVTSAQVSAGVMAERLPAGSRVLVVGTAELAAEIEEVGLRAVWSADDSPVAVVQGYGRDVGWQQLAEGCVAVRGGAWWVATNADRTLPSARGPLPGNGALVAALAVAVDREPDLVVGKPAPALFEQAAKRRGASRAVVVGDRLDTDIEGANAASMDSLFVLTGVHRPVDLVAAPAHQRPTYVAADLGGLFTEGDARPVASGADGWTAVADDGDLVLRGAGETLDELRALCATAWRGDAPPGRIRADGDGAASALASLGLG
ncbi:HAD-IIA family hydrolase [Virgisporangium ochraceum]